MKIYQGRPGVLLTHICGEYLLVATKEARNYCPYIKQLNKTGAYLWTILQTGKTISELEEAISERYSVSDKEAGRTAIQSFLYMLDESHYLLVKETDDLQD